MNWVPVNSHSPALLQEFHLLQNNSDKMVLKYNPHQYSARFTSDGKRHSLFYFEMAGPVSSKRLIVDQYGMERGYILTDKANDRGLVELEGKKYHYQVKKANTSTASLLIFENNPAKPWLSCDFESNSDEILTASFTLGLCWYIFLQQEKDLLVDFAA